MASLGQLEKLIVELEANPQKLHTPELAFFKKYLSKLGAKIPEEEKKEHGHGHGHGHQEEHGHAHAGGCCGHDHGHGEHEVRAGR